MFCAKCGKEIPDDSQFCSKCGHGVNEVAPVAPATVAPAPTKPASSKGWIVLIVVVLVLGLLWFVAQALKAGRMNGIPGISQIAAQPRTQLITDGSLTVAALGSSYYKFVVPPGATNVSVDGHFSATGSLGNDIQVYILDESEFATFQNHLSAQTYYNSGRVAQGSIYAALATGGNYYLVFDNGYSLLSPKAVQATATLHYTN